MRPAMHEFFGKTVAHYSLLSRRCYRPVPKPVAGCWLVSAPGPDRHPAAEFARVVAGAAVGQPVFTIFLPPARAPASVEFRKRAACVSLRRAEVCWPLYPYFCCSILKNATDGVLVSGWVMRIGSA